MGRCPQSFIRWLMLIGLFLSVFHSTICLARRHAKRKHDILDDLDFEGAESGSYYDNIHGLWKEFYDLVDQRAAYMSSLAKYKNGMFKAMQEKYNYYTYNGGYYDAMDEMDLPKGLKYSEVRNPAGRGKDLTDEMMDDLVAELKAENPKTYAGWAKRHWLNNMVEKLLMGWGPPKKLKVRSKVKSKVSASSSKGTALAKSGLIEGTGLKKYKIEYTDLKKETAAKGYKSKKGHGYTPTISDIAYAEKTIKKSSAWTSKSPHEKAVIIAGFLHAHEGGIPNPCVASVVHPDDGDLGNVFHQDQVAALCGVHALNNLWQKVVWNAYSMDKIADCLATELGMHGQAVVQQLRDADNNGHYAFGVLVKALFYVGYGTPDRFFQGKPAMAAAPFTQHYINPLKGDPTFVGFLIKFATIDDEKHVAHHYVSIRWMRNAWIYMDSIHAGVYQMTDQQLLDNINSHVGANEEFVAVVKQN